MLQNPLGGGQHKLAELVAVVESWRRTGLFCCPVFVSHCLSFMHVATPTSEIDFTLSLSSALSRSYSTCDAVALRLSDDRY